MIAAMKQAAAQPEAPKLPAPPPADVREDDPPEAPKPPAPAGKAKGK